jgi:small GTP-binding protein
MRSGYRHAGAEREAVAAMVQKKICMVGVFGAGKTCLVQRYVHSIFSPRYLSTVGVKIDRKDVQVRGEPITLLLWDLEGRDGTHDINPNYVRGAHGLLFVVDGTRRETLYQAFDIRNAVSTYVGPVPAAFAFNKCDLTEEWRLTVDDEESLPRHGLYGVRTSAKTGVGVDAAFQWLAEATHLGT